MFNRHIAPTPQPVRPFFFYFLLVAMWNRLCTMLTSLLSEYCWNTFVYILCFSSHIQKPHYVE